MEGFAGAPAARQQLDALIRYADLRSRIETFWLEREHQDAPTWTEHRDINAVGLATSLVPEGFLLLSATRP